MIYRSLPNGPERPIPEWHHLREQRIDVAVEELASRIVGYLVAAKHIESPEDSQLAVSIQHIVEPILRLVL